jgi:haloacetate dehalogenase
VSDLPELFPGFDAQLISTSQADIFARIGGAGPPLLLLHGFPQTHVMWHAMAPSLAEHFTLVITDLRGYGQSSCPESDSKHAAYSKRHMARDMVEAMGTLGHERFAVLAHDRGARAAYRLALDDPDRITRMALLDIVPTYTMWNGMGQALALRAYHWLFLAQPEPLPETLIAGAPDYYAEHTLASWTASKDLSAFDAKALMHYRAQFATQDRIHACCEDYRAGATCDLEADRADYEAGHQITCPTCVVWGSAGFPGETGSPLDIWREWCSDVEGGAVDCGHFVAEELPQETLKAVLPFLMRS